LKRSSVQPPDLFHFYTTVLDQSSNRHALFGITV